MFSDPSFASRSSARWRLRPTAVLASSSPPMNAARAARTCRSSSRGAMTGVIVQIHLTARNPLVELADGNRRFLLIVFR